MQGIQIGELTRACIIEYNVDIQISQEGRRSSC